MSFFNAWFATPLFLLELLVLDFFFGVSLKKKPYWGVWYIGGGLAFVIVTWWIEVGYTLISGNSFGYGVSSYTSSIAKAVIFLCVYLFSVIVQLVSYEDSKWDLILISCGGYAAQHIIYNLYLLLQLIPFPNEMVELAVILSVREALIFGACGVIYFFSRKRGNAGNLYRGNNPKKLILSLIVILTCIVLSRFANDDPDRKLLAYVAESCYAIIACALILNMLFSLTESDSVHTQVDMYKEILHQEREQYKLSKKNIELINIKCHDLKHQIASLRNQMSEENIAEIEKAVDIYDSAIKTGNDVLDVLLREKLLQCEADHIVLTCMVRGELLSFMDPMDIYSLFGNLLSNAIEATRNLPNPDEKVITLNARSVGGMVSLHEENFFKSDLKMENGLPLTTKKNKEDHGFGVRSMKRTTEKYHGEMVISIEQNKFMIDFLFPIPSKAN